METLLLLLLTILPASAALLITGFWVLRERHEVAYQVIGAAAIILGTLLLLTLIVLVPLIAA